MTSGIGAKIAILLTVVVCATAWVLSSKLREGASQIVISHEVGDLGDEARLGARELQTQLEAVRTMLRRLAEQPPVKAFLDAGNNVVTTDLAEPFLAFNAGREKQAHLRLEVWRRSSGEAPVELQAVPESGQWATLMDSQITSRSIISQMDGAEPLEPYLSEIFSLRVRPRKDSATGSVESGEDLVHAVWCGVRVISVNDPQELFILALINLDENLPDGNRSPLSALNRSPRHLGLVCNEPVRREVSDGGMATTHNLLFLDETKRDAFEMADRADPIRQAFDRLYRVRNELGEVDKIVLPMLPKANVTEAAEEPVPLRTAVWFQQSEPISDKFRAEVAAEIEKNLTVRLGKQIRVGAPRGAVDNIRLLANSRQELERATQLLSTGLQVPLTWQGAVECKNCRMRYVLFPVRSSVMHDSLRFYGVARGAFQEEMEADVDGEFNKILRQSLPIVFLVALVGFVASMAITRPLGKITTAATKFGRARAGSDPGSVDWQSNANRIMKLLPVHRRDEIGVLARAFRQMIGEVVQGHESLRKLNADLDQRVRHRTEELEKANSELMLARDKAHELSRAKDSFLASVSHELRNPLNQVSGFCQLLELTDLDEEQLADLGKIKQAGSQLLALINDILDYQKIVMGGVSLEPETFAVASLLGEVRDAMTFLARENSVDLLVDWSDNVGEMFADKHRLRQVLINLAGNACKFTRNGRVHVHALREITAENRDGWIVISVADTGRGMTPEEQSRLFKPFAKLAANQGNRTGTGLGLVISKGFCELMDGSIHLASDFGKGTTFTVRIPAGKSSGADGLVTKPTTINRPLTDGPAVRPVGTEGIRDSVRESIGEAMTQAPSGRERLVLVIDDDENTRELMVRHLHSQGFLVQTASTGIEGLQLAKSLRPAVISLDAIMPGLDGWAVLAALKADEETASIPVVMVTMIDNQQRGQVMGAADFLVKPIDWAQLAQVLTRYTGDNADRSVLLVEDDQGARELMRRNLQRDGWKVYEAQHGEEALGILAQQSPAVILLDLMMPVMDGFEFLDRFSHLPDRKHIPVIVVTSKDPTPQEFERLNGLSAKVLQKGKYSQEEFLQEIHRRVDHHIQAKPVN